MSDPQTFPATIYLVQDSTHTSRSVNLPFNATLKEMLERGPVLIASPEVGYRQTIEVLQSRADWLTTLADKMMYGTVDAPADWLAANGPESTQSSGGV